MLAGIGAVAIAIALGALAYMSSQMPPVETRPGDIFGVIADSNLPDIRDESLKVQKVLQGLSAPTSMAFVGNDLLILQKNDGQVRMVQDGKLLARPLLERDVETASERGLLGIAVKDKFVFLYLTENDNGVKNRVYRYDFDGQSLSNPVMILDLPGTPGPNHDGGKMTIGPDGLLYVITGDLNRNGQLQNFSQGAEPDYTSSILVVDSDGKPVAQVIEGLDGYYAYGIRNSFGLDFDPKTGILWDTENGPDEYDEINLVRPGFNSGWENVMGPMTGQDNLVVFGGSHYADPVFSWRQPVGVTDIEFLDAEFGKYSYSIFVGDINNGNLYNFAVNSERTGLELDDKVADDADELEQHILGTGFGGITDIETGPDGLLYILSYNGSIYRLTR